MSPKNQSSKASFSRTITKKDVFTGGKYPEFAIFFNLAFFRIAGLVNHLLGKKYEANKSTLEKEFDSWLKNANDTKNDKVFSKLRDYLWKGFMTNKNSSGYVITPEDRKIIIEALEKLNEIRNFQSHYWHDNVVLCFSPELKKHILRLHEDAKLSFMKDYSKELLDYESACKERPLFKTHEGKDYITKDGKAFFLSFFLTRGEMARFLQLHKGYKRTDTNEFKIKHLVYRFYTHRDGAARQHYGQEDNMLGTMTALEQQEILAARQAFKLISYLNDVPEVSNELKLFPLYLPDKTLIINAEQMIAFCKTHPVLKGLNIKPLIKEIKPPKDSNDEVRTVTLEHFLDITFNNYSIHISRVSFHRLILDSIRCEDEGNTILEKLQKFIDERNFIHQFISDNTFRELHLTENQLSFQDVINPYYLFKLRSGERLRTLMGKWLDKIEVAKFDKAFDEKLESFEEAIKTHPIELSYNDFYYETNEKPRAFDHFVHFAVQYLIDFEKVKTWYWMFERFEPELEVKEKMVNGKMEKVELLVNKRRVMFSNQKPSLAKTNDSEDNSSDWRLAIKDGQVIVGIFDHEQTDKTDTPKHKFLLGHRALKNILIASFEDKKEISTFFMGIILDINKLKDPSTQTDTTNLRILQANEIPTSFKIANKQEPTLDTPQLRMLANKRIDKIVDELQVFADNTKAKIPMGRAEKNRQIMRCYKYFDWHYEAKSEFKFLRQNEYQQMSVYHYCLEKRTGKDLSRGKYAFLIQNALPHIPDEIKTLLREAKSIDDLLTKVAKATIALLENWKALMPILKGKELIKRLSKLGISTYKNSHLADYIPFDIHPILVLRKFYAKELLESDGKFSLSKKVYEKRESQLGLRNTHYQYQGYLEGYNTGEKSSTVKKKLIGAMNELLCQDTLLWQMAKDYLKKTSPAYRSFIGNQEDEWKVSNLSQSAICKKILINNYGEITLNIKFHQLDDYLLVESTPTIELAIIQAIKRFENNQQHTEKPQMQITKTAQGYSIAYEEVFKEIQRVFNDAVHWAFYVLDWEKKIVDSLSDAEIAISENNKTQNGAKAHINFTEVCAKTGLTAPLLNKLKDLRNTAFHGSIPAGWTYWEMEKDQDICNLIGYQKKNKIDYQNNYPLNT